MNWSKEFLTYTEHFWQLRQGQLGKLSEKADSYEKGCTEEEALLLKYLLAAVPLSDIADCDIELFKETVRHALKVIAEFSWVRELPEHLFLLYVLPPRINTEQLSRCRPLFYEGLRERVSGLSLKEAILEVNRWCAEHVTYRSTDDRTASALAVYSCGWGRCGEESTFAVNALRSVGIAARQIYAPWWSHCDDNHAWVEVWDGSDWRYLGACEPEPELDRGWFTTAASRAMMIHTRTFLPGKRSDWSFLFPGIDPVDLRAENGVIYETVTHRYADTVQLCVTVRDQDGAPIPGVDVRAAVLNMAEFAEISVLKVGQNGAAHIRLGKGSVYLYAKSDNLFADALVDTTNVHSVELTLHPLCACDWHDFVFDAPTGMAGFPTQLTAAQKDLRAAWLEDAAHLRKEHHPESVSDLGLSDFEARVFRTLSEKDQAGPLPLSVLNDSAPALSREEDFPAEVFEQALLSPRIGLEPLAPWRGAVSTAFTAEELRRFRADPKLVQSWIETHIAHSNSYEGLCGTPAGSLALRRATPAGKDVLFCAICRAAGVPARLSPTDGQPEYWQDGAFCPLFAERSCTVTLRAPAGQAAHPGQNISLSAFRDCKFCAVHFEPIPPGEAREIPLTPGAYRVITTVRLPNGGQLAKQIGFSLNPGEAKALDLQFRALETAHLFTDIALPPVALHNFEVGETTVAELLAQNSLSLLLWLEPGREPTEHILNELRESAGEFAACGCAIHMILPDLAQRDDPTLQKALASLPQARLWQGDFRDTVPALARHLFTDPEKLPLISLADCKVKSLYATAGYNVGTAELLLLLIDHRNED